MAGQNAAASTRHALDPMTPRPFRVINRVEETSDTVTIELVAEDGAPFAFAPGQFNMLYVFGVGESAISISGDPADPSRLVHTIRSVGKVSDALCNAGPGTVIGVRGPFGRPWPVEQATGQDVIFVAGGVGLAPLRPAIYHAINNRGRYGRVIVLYGARSPEDMLYEPLLHEWRGSFWMDVDATVDRATGGWLGRVGVVTKLIDGAAFDPTAATAMVCGPEVMMRFSVEALRQRGLRDNQIYVSMERSMKCALGFCGHCQWGGAFVCRDGPVFRHDEIADLNQVREL
ncbi:MAG: Ni/Fe hydrogenase subunit gamma [Hyphomicrobiales bacterium]|nr:MAG: Ni/Fe hydrogenase subunit gamma [Hyphomicrobiales bacterium]